MCRLKVEQDELEKQAADLEEERARVDAERESSAEAGCQNVKHAVKIMSDTSKCHQHSVAYMKMSSK